MDTDQDRPLRPSIGPVTERKLALNRELANALPEATREEIDQVQGEVQARLAAAPNEQADAAAAGAVEHLRAAPDEALERVRQGEAALPDAGAQGGEPDGGALPSRGS